MLTKPKPLTRSNHFTRAGSSGPAASVSGTTIGTGASLVAAGTMSSTSTAWRPRSVTCTRSTISAPSATEVKPKARSTLLCSRMSPSPSVLTTKP